MFCTELSVLSQVGGALTARPLYCRSWGCEICAPKRQRQLRAIAHRGDPTTFITLTVNPNWHGSPEERAKQLVKAWRNIRQKLARDGIADKIPFLAVFEQTKRGEPHLHIICRSKFIPQSWISAYMKKYMGAPIVDIRRVKDAKGAARYISKYMSKGAHQFEGTKRYWRSQDWIVWDPDKGTPPSEFIAVLRRAFNEVQHDIGVHGVTSCDTLHGWEIKVAWWTSSWTRR